MQDKHVLIIEDEESIREMMRFSLERADFRTSVAGDAVAARTAIVEARPDLVLLGLDAAGYERP
jgi:two-component system phosphate regulon response regulator PhoB